MMSHCFNASFSMIGASNDSLLELAYKLRQAEFRVYNAPDIDHISFPHEISTQQLNLARETAAEKLRSAAVEVSCPSVNYRESLLSSFHFSSDQLSTDASLKSIQDRYRLFRASFPRSIESETENPGDNYILGSNTILFNKSDNRMTNTSQKVFASQAATASLIVQEQNKRYSCDFCSYQTDSKSHLLLHRKNVHCNDDSCNVSPPEVLTGTSSGINQSAVVRRRGRGGGGIPLKRFKCDLCIYSTDCLSHLRRHQGCVHNKMMSYWCYICKKEFSRSEKTKAHFLAFHPNVPYDPKKIRKRSPEQNSEPVAEDESLLEVKQEKKTEVNESLNVDNRVNKLNKKCENIESQDIKVRGKGRERRYSCPKCNYVSRGQWHMKRHMVDVHETTKEFSCRVCCYAASRQHRIISHMRSHGEMFCLFCDYSNADLEIFKRHFSLCNALHRVATVVRCHVCQIDCNDPRQLKAHINETHSVILHSCDLCPYYTDIPDEIYSHSRLHVENELICKVCNSSFASDDLLSSHFQSKHVNQLSATNYSCTSCGHGEAEFSEIVSHIQLHEAEVLRCGRDLCTFKCTLGTSRQLHWQYHHHMKSTILVDGDTPVTDECNI